MAGALSRRDIEMIFRAETDKATRPIADLGKAVKKSRGELQELIELAGKGDVALDKLGSTTRDLKKAQDELGTARGLLTQLNAQESALERAEQKAGDAAKKYAELQQQVDGAEKPTKRLVNSMEAAGRASSAAAENLDRVRSEAAETRAQIEGIIGPVENVGTAFRTIATTSQEIARGLAVAGTAADEFKAKIAGAASASAAAEAKLASDTSFEQAGRQAGLLQSQIDYISQFENRVELLAQAKRELAAQDANFERALASQEAKVGAANVAELRREITETFDAAKRAEQITAFRQIAADANASLNDISRFGVAEDAAAASTQRLGAALSAILSPSSAANRSLDSIEATVTQAATVLEGGRKSASDYGNALNDLQSAAAGINAVAGKIDGYKAQQAAVAASTARFEEARSEARLLAAALAEPGDDAAEIAAKLKRAEAAVETAGNAMQADAQKAAEMGAALRRAGVDVNDLAQAEKRLTAAAHETAAATTEITQRNGGKGGLLGLSPQDATNLSYQINDIFTQLASGQSIFITLAQQGPQIWQIGGVKAYAAELGSLLIPLAAVAAGFGVVALAAAGVYKATDPNQQTQNAAAYLASLGEKSDATAAQLGNATRELERFGAKADEARAIVEQFDQAGLNPDYLNTYAEALRNAAQVTGNDMKDAATSLTEALSGGYDAVVKLNEQYPVLSDAELENIRIMYDSGKADEARQLIFDRFTAKYQEAADKMNGPWTNAWRNLKGAAADFGSYISTKMSGFLKGLRQDLDEAATGVNYLLLRLRGLSAEQAGQAAVNGKGRAPTPPPKNRKPITSGQPKTTAGGQAAIADAERELDVRKRLTSAQRKENAAINARRQALQAGYAPAEAERLATLASAKEGRAIADENAKAGARAAKHAKAERDKAAREAETLANKIAGQQEQLQSALDTMGAKVAKVAAGSLQDQLTAAAEAVNKEYDKLYRQLDAFSKLTNGKGTIGGKSIAEYRATLDANKEILTQQSQLKVYEDQVNDLLGQRKQLLADIEDNAQRGAITPAEAIKQTEEVTSRFDPLIANVTQAAVTFAQKIGGAKPSTELQTFIAKMQGIGNRNSGEDQEAVRKSANANIGREESKLNQILSERNNLVESYNTLAELGLITQDEARRKSADAYNASKDLITQQSASLMQAVTAAKELGAITPQAFEAFQAKMQAIGAQADYLDPRFAQLKQSLNQIITQNAVSSVDRAAKAFGDWAAGSMSLGDAFKEAGMALLDFISDTILMIGKLIIQSIILDAVDKATGGMVKLILAAEGRGNNAGGGGGGFLGGILKMFHGGGKVGSAGGQSTTRISISPAAIAAAPRYHEGTPAVGLKANEQVAVLERGERVLTEKQQRDEAAAQAAGSGSGRPIRQVLAFGDDQVAAAMSGSAGEDVTLTHIRRNIPMLKQYLGD